MTSTFHSFKKFKIRFYFLISFLFFSFQRTYGLPCRNNSILKFTVGSEPIHRTLNSLSICTEHRYSTCCNLNHTNTIIRKVYPYFEQDHFSYECRNFGLQVECSLCDSRINTGVFEGLCEDLCNNWYDSCLRTFFFQNKRHHLAPCEPDSLVCFRLPDLVKNGREFCEKSGHRVAPALEQSCYNGNPISPPHQQRTYGERSQFEKIFEDFYWNFMRLKLWQQGFVLAALCISIVIPLHGLISCCLHCCEPRMEVPFTEEDRLMAISASRRVAERIKAEGENRRFSMETNKQEEGFTSSRTASLLTEEEKKREIEKAHRYNFSESFAQENNSFYDDVPVPDFTTVSDNNKERKEEILSKNDI